MNTAEHPHAPSPPVHPDDARPAAASESSGVVLLSFETVWPIALTVVVVAILTIAVPGLVLVAAASAVFAGPYFLIRRRYENRSHQRIR